VRDDENSKSALKRHAEDHRWKRKTLRRHLERLDEEVGRSMEYKSQKLEELNEMLVNLGRNEQSSIARCKKQFRSLFINIYDLEAGRYKKHPSLNALRDYSFCKGGIYPKAKAKKHGWAVFLKVLT